MLRPVGHVASTLDFVLGAMPAGFSNAQFAFALVASVEITISLEEEKTATAKAGEDEFYIPTLRKSAKDGAPAD
jgi:hypothetical protein